MGRNNVKEPSTSNWHQLQAEEVVRLLDVNLETGLTADEVKRRQEKFGLNRITARPGIPAWRKFLQQFNQPLVYILLAAAAGIPGRAVMRLRPNFPWRRLTSSAARPVSKFTSSRRTTSSACN